MYLWKEKIKALFKIKFIKPKRKKKQLQYLKCSKPKCRIQYLQGSEVRFIIIPTSQINRGSQRSIKMPRSKHQEAVTPELRSLSPDSIFFILFITLAYHLHHTRYLNDSY